MTVLATLIFVTGGLWGALLYHCLIHTRTKRETYAVLAVYLIAPVALFLGSVMGSP